MGDAEEDPKRRRKNTRLEQLKENFDKGTGDAEEYSKRRRALNKEAEIAAADRLEPVHETFEAALAAGQKCGKCYITVAGTKGCRECMGPWFEKIHQRGFQ